MQSQLTIKTPATEFVPIQLNLPGLHNALNSVAAFIAAKIYAIPNEKIVSAMLNFPGVGRRFFSHGKIKVAGGTALLFDDYGHHPKEIQAVLTAAKTAWPNRRVVIVFQPH